MKNIVVIFGGESVEHDISIITGLGVIKNLSSEFNPIAVYVDHNGRWWTGEKLKSVESYKSWSTKGLKQCAFLPGEGCLTVFSRFSSKTLPVYTVVNCLHGHNGEDGAVQGVLRVAKIPSTSESIFANSLCMNKSMAKQVLKREIKVVNEVLINEKDYNSNAEAICKIIMSKIKFPCIVKPNNLGSSVGVGVANNMNELEHNIEVALSFDSEVVVEKFLPQARELNIAVFDDEEIKTSSIEEVITNGEVYSFDDKYSNKKTIRKVPAEIDDETLTKIKQYATTAYKKLKCTGIVRVDFLISGDEIYFNELNTIPGSFSCYLWKDPKINYKSLLTKLIESSVKRFENEEGHQHSYNSDVLKSLGDDDFKMIK